MIVLDASAVVELLLRSPLGERIADRLRPDRSAWHAPDLLDVEVLQVLRRAEARGALTATRASAAIDVLRALPLRRHPHAPLVSRIWELRANCTAYDATYVALAEALGAPLVTCDARLARAPGVRIPVDLLA